MSVLHRFCKLACAGSFGVCVLATGLVQLSPLMAHAQTPGDSSHAKPKAKRGADKPAPAPAPSVAAAPATLAAPGPQPPPAGLIDPQPQPSATAAKKSAPATGASKSKPQPTAARAAALSAPPAAGALRTSDAQPLAAASAKPKTPAPPSAAAPVTPVTPAAPVKPACSIVEPEQPRGGRLEVVGEAFGAVPVVRISGKPARILERRSERVSVQIPADSNGGAITVQQEGRVLECGTLIIIGKNR